MEVVTINMAVARTLRLSVRIQNCNAHQPDITPLPSVATRKAERHPEGQANIACITVCDGSLSKKLPLLSIHCIIQYEDDQQPLVTRGMRCGDADRNYPLIFRNYALTFQTSFVMIVRVALFIGAVVRRVTKFRSPSSRTSPFIRSTYMGPLTVLTFQPFETIGARQIRARLPSEKHSVLSVTTADVDNSVRPQQPNIFARRVFTGRNHRNTPQH